MMKGVNLSFKATNRAAPAMKSFQKGLHGTKKTLDATAVANRRFSQSLGGSSWRRQVQQAGMQISDFSVQVAGGQSAILAFTQNAPQFLQNFGAMGGVIAAAVTILGTFAFSAMRASGAAKSFSEQIDDTSDKLEQYFSLLRSNEGIQGDMFKRAEDSLKLTSQTAKDLLAIARIEAFNSIDKLAESLSDSVTQAGMLDKAMLRTDIGVTGALLNINTKLSGNITTWKDARAQVSEFIQTLRGVQTADSPNAMLQQAIKARDIFKSNVDVQGEMTQEQIKFWKEITQTIRQLELLGAATKATAEDARGSFEAMLGPLDQWLKRRAEGNTTAREMLANMRQEAEMMRTISRYGSDSVEVAKLRATQERRVFEETLRTLDTSSQMKDALRAAFSQMQSLEVSAAGLAAQMSSAAAEAINFVNNLGSASLAGLKAQVGALRSGMSEIGADVAKREAQIRSSDEFKRAMRGPVGLRNEALAGLERELNQVRQIATLEKERSAILKDRRAVEKSAASGGGTSKAIKEATRELEKMRDLTRNIDPALRGILEKTQNLTVDRAKEIKKTFEDIQNSISQTMMSSFKGLLRGTESISDAIKNVLNSIIDKMLDLMFMPLFNRIAGSIAGSVMGNVPGFARGTKSTPGGMVRMNERGGELAVLPGGSTVIPHDLSKSITGGGGGDANVTVNVINKSQDTEVTQRRRRNGNGSETVDVVISESIALGRQDKALGQRTGARPAKVAR